MSGDLITRGVFELGVKVVSSGTNDYVFLITGPFEHTLLLSTTI